MYYKIKQNGFVGFHLPPLVASWIRLVSIRGSKIENKVKFAIADIRVALTKQRVSHVADFLEQQKINELTVEVSDCIGCEEDS